MEIQPDPFSYSFEPLIDEGPGNLVAKGWKIFEFIFWGGEI